VKTGKYSFERGINSLYILVKNTQVSLYSFLRNRGKFHLRRSPLSPDVAASEQWCAKQTVAAVEYYAIAAL